MNDELEKNNTERSDSEVRVTSKKAATYSGGALGNRAFSQFSKNVSGKTIERRGNNTSNLSASSSLEKKKDASGNLDVPRTSSIDSKGKKNGKLPIGKGFNRKNKNTSNAPKLGASKPKDESAVPSALQSKEHNQSLKNRFLNRGMSSTEESESQDEVDNDIDNESSSSQSSFLEKKKLLVWIRMAPVLIIGAVIIFIIMIIVVVLTVPTGVYESFGSVVIDNPEQQFNIYDGNNPELLKAEQEYKLKLDETIDKYKDDYGVTLDKYLLHATLSYRYFTESPNEMFTTDSGITDSDLPTLENNNSSTNEENNDSTSEVENEITVVEYTAATKKIAVVADLMVDKSSGFYTTNFEREGIFYNNLLNSRFLETYYKDFLQNNEVETKKKLVDEIFDYADLAKEIFLKPINNAFISDQIVVHLQTCEVIPYRKTIINNISVFNNPSAGNQTYTDSIDMLNYIKGVVYGEIRGSIDEKNREGLKAFMIASLTYIIGDSRAGFDLKSGEMYFPAGNCRQLCCNPILGCTYSYNGNKYGTSYVGPNRYSNNKFSLGALSPEKTQFLDELLNEIFGYVMVKKGITVETFGGSSSIPDHAGSYLNQCNPGTCFSQVDAMKDAQAGMSYTEILNKYYSNIDFDLINIKEGLYYTTGANGSFNGEVTYYRQGDYKNVTFCGRSGRSISTSGCGVTSAAIIASSFTGNKMYDPVYMMKMAHSGGYCGSGISGTSASFFKHFAGKLGFKYQKYSKGQTNELMEALSKGNAMAIAHMGPGHFTSGGHYIVLAGVNDKGEVMVYDPASPKRNKYWDVNLVADELKSGFYVIIKE